MKKPMANISVTITSPVPGWTASGMTSITWTKTGPVKGYQLAIDEIVIVSPTATSFMWNSQTIADGAHQIKVTAHDAAGHTVSNSVAITVHNAVVPQPVDCVVSPWSAWTPLPGGLTEQRTRTILTPASNGGIACPTPDQLIETRPIVQPSPPPAGLLQQANFTYLGAFRVPLAASDLTSYDYGGTALCYWPGHDSLLICGHDWYQCVGEITIPTPRIVASVSDLQRADTIQAPFDILCGKRLTIDGDSQGSGVKIGGLLIDGTRIIVTAWAYYDAGAGQTKSHFVVDKQVFASLQPTDVSGPFQVGTGTQSNNIGGLVSGYMCPIPSAYQMPLGGTHLTGQDGTPIVGRTSSGPSATVFSPAELAQPTPATFAMGYPYAHPTLGVYQVGGGLGLFNGTQSFRGMIFPDGTPSILYFGYGGTRFCYGQATADPALDFQPEPTNPQVHYCYDPTLGASKGVIGYPYSSWVYAYDVNEFLAAKQGLKNPWDVVPYATWPLTLPFQPLMQDVGYGPADVGSRLIAGAAYDPATRRLFLSAYKNDGAAPLIHVFQVN